MNSKWNVGGHRVVGNLMHTKLKWGVHYKWRASGTKVEGTLSMLESILWILSGMKVDLEWIQMEPKWNISGMLVETQWNFGGVVCGGNNFLIR